MFRIIAVNEYIRQIFYDTVGALSSGGGRGSEIADLPGIIDAPGAKGVRAPTGDPVSGATGRVTVNVDPCPMML